MTYLEGKRKSVRAKSKKVFQQRAIEFEIRRKLNEDGAEVVAFIENAGDFQETLQSALAIAQTLNVRDFLVGLQCEAKAFRNAFCEVQKRVFRGHAVEGVIDFDGGKVLRVEAEHFAVGELLGIEIALPLFIGVSGSADAKLA
jgi:hypothetical protein